jgi:hypothetical protein
VRRADLRELRVGQRRARLARRLVGASGVERLTRAPEQTQRRAQRGRRRAQLADVGILRLERRDDAQREPPTVVCSADAAPCSASPRQNETVADTASPSTRRASAAPAPSPRSVAST